MRLPFLQFSWDLLEHAGDIAVELEEADLSENDVVAGLLRLIGWGLSRCPDDKPPSLNDVVPGPNAARLIARAAGVPLEHADAFVKACAKVQPKPVLEVLPNGAIRLRGLRRYDEAWLKNQTKERQAHWREKLRADHAAESNPEPGRNRAGSEVPDPDPDPDVDPELESKPPPPTPSVPGEPLAVVVDEIVPTADRSGIPTTRTVQVVKWQPTSAGCWEFIQLTRELLDLDREANRPKEFDDWFARAFDEAGARGIEGVLRSYLRDPTIAADGWPTQVLIGKRGRGGIWDARKPDTKRRTPS